MAKHKALHQNRKTSRRQLTPDETLLQVAEPNYTPNHLTNIQQQVGNRGMQRMIQTSPGQLTRLMGVSSPSIQRQLVTLRRGTGIQRQFDTVLSATGYVTRVTRIRSELSAFFGTSSSLQFSFTGETNKITGYLDLLDSYQGMAPEVTQLRQLVLQIYQTIENCAAGHGNEIAAAREPYRKVDRYGARQERKRERWKNFFTSAPIRGILSVSSKLENAAAKKVLKHEVANKDMQDQEVSPQRRRYNNLQNNYQQHIDGIVLQVMPPIMTLFKQIEELTIQMLSQALQELNRLEPTTLEEENKRNYDLEHLPYIISSGKLVNPVTVVTTYIKSLVERD
jgi:hypothetical protein